MIQIGPRRARALIILCIYAGPGCQQLLGKRDIAIHCCLMQRRFTSASCYESAEYFGVIPHPGSQACESRGLSNPKTVLMEPASWTITPMTSASIPSLGNSNVRFIEAKASVCGGIDRGGFLQQKLCQVVVAMSCCLM